jgi:hypothetical protein
MRSGPKLYAGDQTVRGDESRKLTVHRRVEEGQPVVAQWRFQTSSSQRNPVVVKQLRGGLGRNRELTATGRRDEQPLDGTKVRVVI